MNRSKAIAQSVPRSRDCPKHAQDSTCTGIRRLANTEGIVWWMEGSGGDRHSWGGGRGGLMSIAYVVGRDVGSWTVISHFLDTDRTVDRVVRSR